MLKSKNKGMNSNKYLNAVHKDTRYKKLFKLRQVQTGAGWFVIMDLKSLRGTDVIIFRVFRKGSRGVVVAMKASH